MAIERFGPIAYYEHQLDKVCEVNVGHKHNYDHVTYLWRGKVRILYKFQKDGQEVSDAREYEAPAMIHIKAEVLHEIKALTPDVRYFCVFSHRDLDGLVSQEFQGNQKAYE